MPANSSSLTMIAAEYIRALLRGGSPNGTPPEAFGAYQDIIRNLHDAHASGGTPKVKEAWNGVVGRQPELAEIVSGEQSKPERKIRWTADELLAAEFPPAKWIVPDLLPEGLTILGGRPKIGKSWLALQIALAVASGGRVFDRPIERAKVLYLALEDSYRRLQKRMKEMGWPASTQATFLTDFKTLDTGGLDALQSAMEEEGYRLVVIDTLSRALSGKQDQNNIADMTTVLSTLQRLALDQGAGLLAIDHHRKPSGVIADPIDDILGSTGKGAVADSVMGLYRERGKKGALLRLVGRDLDEEKELALDWDTRLCSWQLLGDAAQVARSRLQAEILEAYAELGGEATTTEIADHLVKDRGNVSREISELVQKGRLERGKKRGREQPYNLPGRGE